MFGWRRESDIDCAGHQQFNPENPEAMETQRRRGFSHRCLRGDGVPGRGGVGGAHRHGVGVFCRWPQCVCGVQWFSPLTGPHGSFRPSLIPSPTRYYRDTAEKTAEGGLADRYAGDMR